MLTWLTDSALLSLSTTLTVRFSRPLLLPQNLHPNPQHQPACPSARRSRVPTDCLLRCNPPPPPGADGEAQPHGQAANPHPALPPPRPPCLRSARARDSLPGARVSLAWLARSLGGWHCRLNPWRTGPRLSPQPKEGARTSISRILVGLRLSSSPAVTAVNRLQPLGDPQGIRKELRISQNSPSNTGPREVVWRGGGAWLVGTAAVGKTSATYRSTHASAFITTVFFPPLPVLSRLVQLTYQFARFPARQYSTTTHTFGRLSHSTTGTHISRKHQNPTLLAPSSIIAARLHQLQVELSRLELSSFGGMIGPPTRVTRRDNSTRIRSGSSLTTCYSASHGFPSTVR